VHGENKDALRVKVRGKPHLTDLMIERENNIKMDMRELSVSYDVNTKINCTYTHISGRPFLLSVTRQCMYISVAY